MKSEIVCTRNKCAFLTIVPENLFSIKTAIPQTSAHFFILFLNKSYVIICLHMHINVALTPIHGRGGRSKHTALISFLLPRLINNSWVTIAVRVGAGGGGGHPEILSLSRMSSKTGRGNQSLKPLCAEKGESSHRFPSHPPTALAKRQTVITIIIPDTTAPVQASLSEAITFSFPIFPCAGL